MLSVPIAVLEAELKWTFLGEYESCRRISLQLSALSPQPRGIKHFMANYLQGDMHSVSGTLAHERNSKVNCFYLILIRTILIF